MSIGHSCDIKILLYITETEILCTYLYRYLLLSNWRISLIFYIGFGSSNAAKTLTASNKPSSIQLRLFVPFSF